jgi:hypothetical protein
VLEALLGHSSGFVRTPKFKVERREDSWAGKRYSTSIDRAIALELLLGFYSLLALVLFGLSWKLFVWPFMAIYTAGFFYVATLGIKQHRDQRSAAHGEASRVPASLQISAEEPSVVTDPISLSAEEVL